VAPRCTATTGSTTAMLVDPAKLEKLLEDMAGPMYSWRLASGELERFLTQVEGPNGPRYRSAELRRTNALDKIHDLITEYNKD
jgi:hypothetical protein